MTTPARLTPFDLLDRPPTLELGDSGSPLNPVAVIDLEPLGTTVDDQIVTQLQRAAAQSEVILIGRGSHDQVGRLAPIAEALDITLIAGADQDVPRCYVTVGDVDAAEQAVIAAVSTSPHAALVLRGLLRRSEALSVVDGLVTESLAYSMLLAGAEFARWLANQKPREDPEPVEPPVRCARDGNTLTITLNRPERHNAFGRHVRDALCDALDLALLDPSIDAVRIVGCGPSFCSGGDLAEFGTQRDVAAGHQIRVDRSVGRRLHALADRTVVELHGACVGAGIELPAFAGTVRAKPGAWFQLPELSMGLIPGAGGTVSLSRRIGRWRAAWLAMSGTRLELADALSWGLVDSRADG